ncbi:MAG TPA: Ku protein [Candidatus Limnocylindrales bacterium]|nr:Ku protein [Candidatus Limnocylindrales bacterium]
MASTVWKGHLTFGLLSLPVKLYSAARSETVSFNQLHKDDHSRVKQVLYCQLEDKPIQRSDIVKGYEYEKDKYVVVEDEEIKKVAPKTAKTMEVLEFVKTSEVDPVFFDASYYLAPDEAGEKPYALLFEALRQSGCVGVAKIAMHNREHIVILRPGARGILLHTMYYMDEIRQVEEFRTDTSMVQEKELGLARMLIESLLAPFEPDKYKDNYRENLMAMIKAKVEGKQIVEPAAPAHKAPVIDILEALKMSLAEGKKPPQSVRQAATGRATADGETEPAKPRKGRKTSGGD